MREAGGPNLALEYTEVVDPDTLQPVEQVQAGVVCAIAARLGSTRLIDNTILGD
jgi:pantoate ligase/cytidylate kinase